MKKLVHIMALMVLVQQGVAQMPILKGFSKFGGAVGKSSGTSDTSKSDRNNSLGFEHRDDKKDSLTISYRFIDSVRNMHMDSSINDFDKYFSIPSKYQYCLLYTSTLPTKRIV